MGHLASYIFFSANWYSSLHCPSFHCFHLWCLSLITSLTATFHHQVSLWLDHPLFYHKLCPPQWEDNLSGFSCIFYTTWFNITLIVPTFREAIRISLFTSLLVDLSPWTAMITTIFKYFKYNSEHTWFSSKLLQPNAFPDAILFYGKIGNWVFFQRHHLTRQGIVNEHLPRHDRITLSLIYFSLACDM